MLPRPWSDEADAEIVEMLDQPVAEIEDVPVDRVHADALDQRQGCRKAMNVRQIEVSDLETAGVGAELHVVGPGDEVGRRMGEPGHGEIGGL